MSAPDHRYFDDQPDPRKLRAAERYSRGDELQEICSEAGVHPSTIYTWLAELGVPLRGSRRRASSSQREQARELYARGESLPQIAERVGVDRSTLHRWKRDEGWPARTRFSEQELERTVESYRRTRSLRASATELGVGPGAVRTRLAAAGEPVLPRGGRGAGSERKRKAAQRFDELGTTMAVAREFGVDPSTVGRWLDEFGRARQRGRPGPGEARLARMRRLFSERYSFAEIGKEVGLSANTVIYHLRKMGLHEPRRRQRGSRTATA